MSRRSRKLDQLRTGCSELENHYIDEFVSGRLSRREFVQRGTVLGMSTSLLGAVVAACGGKTKTSHATTSAATGPKPKRGGTLRLALLAPGSKIDPLTSDDTGIVMLTQVGEYLLFDSNLLHRLVPMLATSWSHNGDATVWTFKLRPGVRFNNGAPMTADDVVWTFQQLSNPKLPSNALSTFQGVLSPSGVVKIDSHTVAFHLDSANGNFPYLVSSDNYNAIIVPKGTDYSSWQSTFVGTGAFKLTSYQQNVGASFARNPYWWGGQPYLDGTHFLFYANAPAQVLALQGGDVDVIVQFAAVSGEALFNNPAYTIVHYTSSVHRELSLRCDVPPFDDPRVRKAVAYSLDRPALVSALLKGYGVVGNDTPFAPIFPSSCPNVPQRKQNLALGRQLMREAGHPAGVTAPFYTEINQEIPLLAQAIKSDAAKVGVNFKLVIESQDAYYGKSTFGNSDWLDGTASLVDYGARGVPNVYLSAALTSHGPWNAAHFHNPTYDKLVRDYIAAPDLQSQRSVACKIERLLLDETPIIIPYWLDGLTASTARVHGLNPTAIPQIYLDRAYID